MARKMVRSLIAAGVSGRGVGADAIWRSVVAGTRAHSWPVGPVSRHLDIPEGSVQGQVGGRVRQRVLIPDIARHLMRDAVHFGRLLGEIRFAAGDRRKFFQRPPAALGLAALFLAQQPDGVYQYAAILRGFNQVFEADQTAVVVAV